MWTGVVDQQQTASKRGARISMRQRVKEKATKSMDDGWREFTVVSLTIERGDNAAPGPDLRLLFSKLYCSRLEPVYLIHLMELS